MGVMVVCYSSDWINYMGSFTSEFNLVAKAKKLYKSVLPPLVLKYDFSFQNPFEVTINKNQVL